MGIAGVVAPRPHERAAQKSRVLPAGPQTWREARWFLLEALKDQDVNVDVGAAAVLTGELASNAARHGGEPIGMSVNIEDDGLRISVHDRGPGFDPTDEAIRSGGGGVRLVEALASDWGVRQDEEGTEVWFKI